jgi:AcrR family transcriptional regulator
MSTLEKSLYSSPKKPKDPAPNKGQETRNRILIEATKAFAKYGYERSSVRDICAASDVKHSMITYHFGTKQELWLAVVDDLYKEILSLVSSLNFSNDSDIKPLDQLKHNLRTILKYTNDHPEYFKIVYLELLMESPRTEMLKPYLSEVPLLIQSIYNRASSAGLAVDLPLIDLFYILSGALNDRVIFRRRFGEPQGSKMSDEEIESHISSLMRMLTWRKNPNQQV